LLAWLDKIFSIVELIIPTTLDFYAEISKKFALRVELLLDHRLGWLSRGYRVCVPMHHLLGTVFRSKDHRRPQGVWGDLLPPAYLGLGPLYPHNVGELRSHILRYDLGADELAIATQR